MSRAWGYIAIAVAALIGAGALLLPMPESIEVAKSEPVEKQAASRPAPPAPPARQRPKPAAKPKKPPEPVVKTFPMQDTTKSRLMVQPKPNG